MPIYEYECQECQHRFEEWAKISDPYPEECPECGAKKLERIISLTSTGEVAMDAKELYERKIKPEAKAIADRIRAGDENAAADIFGVD